MKAFRHSGIPAFRQPWGIQAIRELFHLRLADLCSRKDSSIFELKKIYTLLLLFLVLPIFSTTPNLQPTLSPISDTTILEDSAIQGIALSGISDGGDSFAQTLTISAVSSNPAIVLNPSVDYTSPSTTATQALLRRLAFSNVGVPPVNGVRTVRVYLTDGSGGTSLPVTTTINVQAINVAPVVTLPTAAVAWTEHASPSLIDTAATVSESDSTSFNGGTMVVTLTSAVVGDDLSILSVAFRVSDGVTWSSPSMGTLRLTAGLAAVRPLIISSPPRKAVIGATYTYQISAALNALPPGADLRYLVVGAPAGATVTVTRITATAAMLTWNQTGAPNTHRQLGVLVNDVATGTPNYQAIHVFWLAVAPGGAT
jgi:hypothetical protein